MSFFGAVFLALTFGWQWHFSGVALALPFLVFALIVSAALRVSRLRGGRIDLSDRARRAILWSSAGEGIGFAVAFNIVVALHRPHWRLPAMALIVGLHFLPIAYVAVIRAFYILGGALITVALIGFAMPTPFGAQFAGITSAMCLWAASIISVVGDWKIRARPYEATQSL